MGFHLLEQWELLDEFKLDREATRRWLAHVEGCYFDTPYHNSMHAAGCTCCKSHAQRFASAVNNLPSIASTLALVQSLVDVFVCGFLCSCRCVCGSCAHVDVFGCGSCAHVDVSVCGVLCACGCVCVWFVVFRCHAHCALLPEHRRPLKIPRQVRDAWGIWPFFT